MCGYEDVATIYSNIVHKIDVSTIIPNAFLKIDDNIIKKWESYISPDTSSNGTQLSSNNVLIFASQWNLSVIETKKILSSKLYSCKIYDSNGMLIRNYIPCTNESGKKGLYDTVNGSFEGLRGGQICLITTEVDSSWNSFYQETIIESVINFSEKIKSDLYISYVQKESDEYNNWKSHYETIRVLSNKNQTIVNSCFESEGYISSAAQIVSISPAYDEWYTYKPEELFILNNIQIVNINNRKYVKLTYPSDGILSISLYCNPGDDYTMIYNINIEISYNDTYDLGELSHLNTYAIFYTFQSNSKYAYHYQALKYV